MKFAEFQVGQVNTTGPFRVTEPVAAKDGRFS